MNTYKSDTLAILQCPITGSKLNYLSEEEILYLNILISQNIIISLNGKNYKIQLKEALVSERLELVYPIIDGIIYLLPKHALIDANNQKIWASLAEYDECNLLVEKYYENFGWKKSRNNLYNSTEIFEDLRDITKEYVNSCHTRIQKYIPKSGKYILDAGSGAIDHPEYFNYSKNYQYRVCVDISVRALQEAKNKLEDKGIYIVANIAKLPLCNNQFDAAVSLNAIPHIPKDKQLIAFKEIHRVLVKGGSGIIVYDWGAHSNISHLFVFPFKLISDFKYWIIKNLYRLKTPPKLYFYAHSRGYFSEKKLGFKIKTLVWRSISVPFMKIYIHKNLLGHKILKFIYNIEEKYPSLTGLLGEHPLFYFKKI